MYRKLEHIFTVLGQNVLSGTFPNFILILKNSCELQFALPLSLRLGKTMIDCLF